MTGGAGFIGANFVHHVLRTHPGDRVVVFDKLTYAGNLANLEAVADDPRYAFVHADIGDRAAVERAVVDHGLDTIVNFAAESHVDRSIDDPEAFLRTDVHGTYTLLEVARQHGLRYHQVSTDEVYGHVADGASRETDPVAPRSPYAASKASADLFVHAYHVTYGLVTTISRGSNNVGPFQYPEKAVPLFATNAIDGLPLPVYGDGRQERDYQWVGDHCEAIDLILDRGDPGEVYNVGTGRSIQNLTMVDIVLQTLDRPQSLVQHVADRPGHDRRYAIDARKIERELGWRPGETFETGIRKTVQWYLENAAWVAAVQSGSYRDWVATHYAARG